MTMCTPWLRSPLRAKRSRATWARWIARLLSFLPGLFDHLMGGDLDRKQPDLGCDHIDQRAFLGRLNPVEYFTFVLAARLATVPETDGFAGLMVRVFGSRAIDRFKLFSACH